MARVPQLQLWRARELDRAAERVRPGHAVALEQAGRAVAAGHLPASEIRDSDGSVTRRPAEREGGNGREMALGRGAHLRWFSQTSSSLAAETAGPRRAQAPSDVRLLLAEAWRAMPMTSSRLLVRAAMSMPRQRGEALVGLLVL